MNLLRTGFGMAWGSEAVRVLEPLGLAPDRPLTALKEAVAINIELLAGRAAGPARITWTDGNIPLAMAGRGPKAQALAAEKADWVILSAKAPADLPETAARIHGSGSSQDRLVGVSGL